MQSRYVLFSISVPEEFSDLATGVLSTYPLIGIEVGEDKYTVCFEQNDWQEHYKDSIIEDMVQYGIPASHISTEIEESQNWNAEWEASVEPVVVNERIVIVPEWRAADFDFPLTLIITPKMSFGTGHHATTRMMCKLLETSVIESDTWTDAGTGTGVLAILAVKLGAKSVYAFDNNEWSVLNTHENVLRNKVENSITIEQLEIQDVVFPMSDGLAANLYRHLVIPYAGAFVRSVKPGGIILLSGILIYDKDEVIQPFIDLECVVEELLQETEWCAIKLRTPLLS
ncbi:MAG: 50S ribosomal protein L11 methyltransferase [Ignavibacteria bacterium]|nr:50S ribosomal protein L11 methyltransferase [Ignavibacteria bacterium]